MFDSVATASLLPLSSKIDISHPRVVCSSDSRRLPKSSLRRNLSRMLSPSAPMLNSYLILPSNYLSASLPIPNAPAFRIVAFYMPHKPWAILTSLSDTLNAYTFPPFTLPPRCRTCAWDQKLGISPYIMLTGPTTRASAANCSSLLSHPCVLHPSVLLKTFVIET